MKKISLWATIIREGKKNNTRSVHRDTIHIAYNNQTKESTSKKSTMQHIYPSTKLTCICIAMASLFMSIHSSAQNRRVVTNRTTTQQKKPATPQQKIIKEWAIYATKPRSVTIWQDYIYYVENNENNAVISIDRKTGEKSTLIPGIAGVYEGARPRITGIRICAGRLLFTLRGKEAVYEYDNKSVKSSGTIEDATGFISNNNRYALFYSRAAAKDNLLGYDLWDMENKKFIYTFGYEEIGSVSNYKPFISSDGCLWCESRMGFLRVAPGGKSQHFSLSGQSYIQENGVRSIEGICIKKGDYIYAPCNRRIYRINTMSPTPRWEEYAKIPFTQDNKFLYFSVDSQGNMLTSGDSNHDYNTQYWRVEAFDNPQSLGQSLTTGFMKWGYSTVTPSLHRIATDEDDNFIFVDESDIHIYNPKGIVGYTKTVGKIVE
ncbi:MAG: hypothetical protein IJ610_00600 [Bacteroidaceae bacterium]|nr:hypothetical protein [Bacteroidaceae bacterium]